MADQIAQLRAALKKQKLDGFIVPMNDEFMGEYIPDCAKRLTWLTGFTGSAGLAIVTLDKAAFFTDGRYTLQAKAEVKGFELYNSGDVSPEKFLEKYKGKVVGYDPALLTLHSVKRYEKAGVMLKPVANIIDALWKDRPAPPVGPVRIYPATLAGEESKTKRARIAKEIAAKGADVLVITASDSLCWLLNIRGGDLAFTPFVLAYALLDKAGKARLYIDKTRVSKDVAAHVGKDVSIKAPGALAADLKALGKRAVLYDPSASPIWFYQQLKKAGAKIIEAGDPIMPAKARKNAAELEGVKNAHIRDGLAVTKFLCWLDGADKAKLTEMDVATKLESFRKAAKEYLEPSFTTIAGSGPNGAVVHYRVTPETNRKLDNNSLLLLDSGGQYLDGTTDITRTVAIGTPTPEMKDRFTRVLKGHIALARAQFPEGTSGSQLDALARQYLWTARLDYDHGTGHGVGTYLSVHEGPQRISKRGGDAPLMPGMVVSNEPGYYKTGEYGIRIESLVAVREVYCVPGKEKRYFSFETITLAPIDMRVVESSLLTHEEMQWLEGYHRQVYEAHAPHLSAAEKEWFGHHVRVMVL